MSEELGPLLATFRPALGPIRRLALGLYAGVAVIALATNALSGRPLAQTLRGLLVAAPLMAALVPVLAALVWPLGLSVHAGGVRGRTFWGRKAFMPWADVSGLSARNASGMLFAVIESGAGGSDIWTLPDVVSRPEFQRLVAGLAGASNPLRLEPPPIA